MTIKYQVIKIKYNNLKEALNNFKCEEKIQLFFHNKNNIRLFQIFYQYIN